MTFGQKLFQLRKSHGFSQEELADKLNTSRQAVSKWENNNGYPETEKIIMISKLFEVNLEELLMDDRELGTGKMHAEQQEKRGYYISRETANGFLLYYKRKFLLLAVACSIILGCNSASYTSTEHQFFSSGIEPFLTTVSVMIALAIVIYIVLKQNPYRVLRKKELDFAQDVRREIVDEFHKIKKMLAVGITLGLLIFGLNSIGFHFQMFQDMKFTDIIFRIVVSMVLTGVSSFMVFFCIGIYWSYAVLLRQHTQDIYNAYL